MLDIILCLVPVQTRIYPNMTEKLLTGCPGSSQTNTLLSRGLSQVRDSPYPYIFLQSRVKVIVMYK